jgi:recombination protein RecR
VTALPKAIARVMAELQRLPGIGSRSAQRLAFHLLRRPAVEVAELAQALTQLHAQTRRCSVCNNLADQDPCAICSNPARDPAVLCVVEEPTDILPLERCGEFRGRCHVLLGTLSPLDGVGPDQLKIAGLLERARQDGIQEVILATNPTVEGESTAIYIAKLLRPLGIKVTRIGLGLPVGGDLDYADEITLARALSGRREL